MSMKVRCVKVIIELQVLDFEETENKEEDKAKLIGEVD